MMRYECVESWNEWYKLMAHGEWDFGKDVALCADVIIMDEG